MAHNKIRSVKFIKRFFKPTVGKLLGILMAAYFIFTFISLRSRTAVNFYEVEEGSLVKEHNYTGLIIRNEEPETAEASGYIYFYVADGRKTAAGNPVYLIDAGGDLSSYLSSHSEELSNINSSKVKDIRTEILHDSRTFSVKDFNTLYDIYDNLEAKALEYSSLSIFSTISDDLKAEGISFQEFPASKNGTVCYYIDGYEDITENDLTPELFDKTKYSRSTIKAGDLVESGSAVYKLITDENWSIAFILGEDEISELKNSTSLTISFPDKGFGAKVPFRIIYGTDGTGYGLISMSSYLVQFTSDRFVDFDIVTNDVSGLKIPDKAITTKDFYVIPAYYMMTDDGGNTGFNKAVVGENGTSYQFVITDIYSRDDDYCYIECDEDSAIKPGDYVIPPNGADLNNAGSDSSPSANVPGKAENGNNSETDVSESSAESGSQENENNLRESGNSSETQPSHESSDTSDNDEEAKNTQTDSEDIAGHSGLHADSYDEEEADTGNASGDKEAIKNEEALSADDSSDNTSAESTKDTEGSTDNNDVSADGYSDGSAVPKIKSDDAQEHVGDAAGSDSLSAPPDGIADGYDERNTKQPQASMYGNLYQINAKMPLKGVYNINKGYTVFRKVEILESANGYSIVKKNTAYGLSPFDHIVLDASAVDDGQLIYR